MRMIRIICEATALSRVYVQFFRSSSRFWHRQSGGPAHRDSNTSLHRVLGLRHPGPAVQTLHSGVVVLRVKLEKVCMKIKSLARAAVMGTTGLFVAMALSACGGGDASLDVVVATPFDINVIVGGRPVSGVLIQPGASQTVFLPVGESIELDASEPVTWTLIVGGSTITGTGVTVDYGGVGIRLTAQSRSRILIDTDSAFALSAPLNFTLIATSTLDFAQVATIRVVLTN